MLGGTERIQHPLNHPLTLSEPPNLPQMLHAFQIGCGGAVAGGAVAGGAVAGGGGWWNGVAGRGGLTVLGKQKVRGFFGRSARNSYMYLGGSGARNCRKVRIWKSDGPSIKNVKNYENNMKKRKTRK